MTRKEAIKILSCRDNRGLPITWQDGFVDAVDTAIEALELASNLHQICITDAIDLISRQAVVDRINKQREHLNPSEDFRDLIGDSAYKTCIEFIERLPSAQKTEL